MCFPSTTDYATDYAPACQQRQRQRGDGGAARGTAARRRSARRELSREPIAEQQLRRQPERTRRTAAVQADCTRREHARRGRAQRRRRHGQVGGRRRGEGGCADEPRDAGEQQELGRLDGEHGHGQA